MWLDFQTDFFRKISKKTQFFCIFFEKFRTKICHFSCCKCIRMVTVSPDLSVKFWREIQTHTTLDTRSQFRFRIPNPHWLVRRFHTFSGSNKPVLIRCLWSKSNRSTEDSNTTTSIQVCQSVPLVCHGVPKIRGKHHGTFENDIF